MERSLTALAHDLYGFSLLPHAAVPPFAARERLHFWYRERESTLRRAIESAQGFKVAVRVSPRVDLADVTRKLVLISDLLVVSHAELARETVFAPMAVPPDFSSPIIGALLGKRIDDAPAGPQMADIKVKPPDAAPLNQPSRKESKRKRVPPVPENMTDSRPLATRFQPGQGLLALAWGAIAPFPESTYAWLLDDAKDLLLQGRLTYAPFLNGQQISRKRKGSRTSVAPTKQLLGAMPLVEAGGTWLPGPMVDGILHLEIPYLRDIPLPVLARVLEDEQEAVTYFRNALLSACEELKAHALGSEDMARLVMRIQRETVDEGVQRLMSVVKALERRRWYRISAITAGTVGAGIAAALTGSLPGVIGAGAAGLAAALHAFESQVQDAEAVRSHSFYLVLRLRDRLRRLKLKSRQPWRIPWAWDELQRSRPWGDDTDWMFAQYDKEHSTRYVW